MGFLILGFPGWIKVARDTPKIVLNKDVTVKKVNVLIAIFPFKFVLILDVPAIRLDIMRGRVTNFRVRRNSSPG